jgi:hypothetical protein
MSAEEPPDKTEPAREDSPDRDDPMGPPKEPCECWCMHCRRTFMSSGMWFQRVINDPSGFKGFWMCPTPNCEGKGFTFDIFPVDPDHPANDGWVYDDDDDEEGYEDEDFFEDSPHDQDGEADAYDPDETKWKELDELAGEEDFDDDLEGEEWKHGLQPGERPPEPDWMEQARLEREAEERQYDEPDRRPREVDWSDREDRRDRKGPPPEYGGEWSEDDIPF